MKTKTGALPNSAGFPGKNMVGYSKTKVNYLTIGEFFELMRIYLGRNKMESDSIKGQKKCAKMMAKK